MSSSNKFIRIITVEYAGSKLISLLKKDYSDYPYTLLCKLVRKGNIRINGLRSQTNQILKINDKIKIPNVLKQNLEEQKIKISKNLEEKAKSWIIYKDEEILIINKPNGFAVQGGSKVKTSIDCTLQTLKFEKNERPRLVHRLDKDTSGLLIVARNKIYAHFYTNLFKEKSIKKVYLAIVHGESKKISGRIVLDIETNNKMFDALTKYRTLYKNKLYSLLLIIPETGRKHQIRKHLSSINLPIVGDMKYSISEQRNLKSRNLNLHAYCVHFKNKQGILKSFKVDLPSHMKKNLISFKLNFDLKSLNIEKFFDDKNF